MSDAIREAFEKWWLIEMGHRIHDQRSGDGYFPSDADASWEAWQAALQSSQTAPAVPVDIEMGTGDVMIADLKGDDFSGVVFYRDQKKFKVGQPHPEMSGVPCDQIDARIFSVVTSNPESLKVLHRAVGRALNHLGHSPDAGKVVPVPWPKKEDITEDMRAGFERLYRAKAERDGRTLERNEQGAYKHLPVDSDWTFYQRAWADALEATSPAADGGEVEVNRVANAILEAWKKAEPDHSITKHPISYIATFADMARAAIAATHPAESREEIHKLGQQLYEAARCLGCAQAGDNPDAAEYWSSKAEAILARLRASQQEGSNQ